MSRHTHFSKVFVVVTALSACEAGETAPPSGDQAEASEVGETGEAGQGTDVPEVDTADALVAGVPAARLGSVSVVAESCADGVGSLPNTTCKTLSVSCPRVNDVTVRLRVTEPVGAELQGTVVFGTGGLGTGFYDANPTAAAMIQDVVAAGFRAVQRAWDGDDGWFEGDQGLAAAACRYATVLTWTHDNLHAGGGFCATGNSAGSGEIAYALARYSRSALLDLAVLTGGPPLTRLDYGCSPSEPWLSECPSLMPEESTCGGSCQYSSGGKELVDGTYAADTVCSSPTATDVEVLAKHGVLAPGAATHYPSTLTYFIFGDQDCDAAVPQGMLYRSTITSETRVVVAANTKHNTFASLEGAAAILEAIETECAPRP